MTQSFTRRADALARDSYYEATAVRPAVDDPALDGTIDVDVCVIGAGFAGLSTALDCRARGLSVAVIDAHRPAGARRAATAARRSPASRRTRKSSGSSAPTARAPRGRCRSTASR